MGNDNIIIGWPNRAPQAQYTGGVWLPQLPLENLQSRHYWLAARSKGASLDSTQWRMDFGQERNLRCIAVLRHNLSRTARIRVQLGSEEWGSDRFDSMWQPVWRMTFDGDLLEWESNSYWEGSVDDPFAFVGSNFAAFIVLPDWINARHVRIQIDDRSNASGFVQIGQLFVGGGFQPFYNPDYGLKDGLTDKSEVERTSHGYAFFDTREKLRNVKFLLDALSLTEGDVVYEMLRRQGVTKQVLYLPYPDDQQRTQRYGFLGRFEELSALDYPRYGDRSVGLTITEE